MKKQLASLAFTCIVLAPFVAAVPGDPADPGLDRACDVSGNKNPCRWVIPDTTIGPGKNKTYNGSYVATGTVVIEAGGSATVVDSNILFQQTSGGFIVETGGVLNVVRSDLFENGTTGSPYVLDAHAGSTFKLNDSTITGGEGVKIATELAQVSGNTLSEIPLAMFLDGVSIVLQHNAFVGNDVALNESGGAPTVQHNSFIGGTTCIRDWRTDPTIVHNVFRGCHVGIFHEQSESVISYNDMMDDAHEPGTAIRVVDTLSPTIEGNWIRNYGEGILVQNARAYIRNNTIEQNVGAGIRIAGNAAPMDIQGNLVRANGGDGIRLVNAFSAPVVGNVIEDNVGAGIRVVSSPAQIVEGNTIRGNDAGIVVVTSDEVTLRNNDVSTSAGHGVVLDHSFGAIVDGVTTRTNGGDGLHIAGSSARVTNVNASENSGNGVTFDPMGPLDPLAITEFTLVRGMFNGGAGLLNVQGNATIAHDSWWEGNVGAGVHNADLASLIDASACYWGAASGPTHALNPLGTGDEVVGNVLYHPFLTAPPGSADARAAAVGPYSLIPRGA